MLQEHWLSPFVLGRPDPAFEGVQCHAVSHSTLNEISANQGLQWYCNNIQDLLVHNVLCPDNGRLVISGVVCVYYNYYIPYRGYFSGGKIFVVVTNFTCSW